MKRKKVLVTFTTVVAFALTVWTIGAAVNLATIDFNATSGEIVSASEFNDAFATANSNFAALEDAVNTNRIGGAQTLDDGCGGVSGGTIAATHTIDLIPPADGYALVQATGWIESVHVSTEFTFLRYGLSTDGTNYASAQDLEYELPDTLPGGVFNLPLSTHQMFPVTGGITNTFYLVAHDPTGSTHLLCDVTLTAMFVPEQFGAISTVSGAP